jgi:hypothetical protein
MWTLIIGAIIGAIASIITSGLVAMFVEFMRRPRLKLSIETPPRDAPRYNPPRNNVSEARFVRVIVHNEQLPGWARWMLRGPALQCKAAITFHHHDNEQNVFGEVMNGRWSGSQEPVPLPVIGPAGQQFQILDCTRLTLGSQIDIYPGRDEALDIVTRFDNDDPRYGWNNEAYFSTPLWRNPKWVLPSGRYLVKVIINSSGQKFVDHFRLINTGPRATCRLEPKQIAIFWVVCRATLGYWSHSASGLLSPDHPCWDDHVATRCPLISMPR